MNRQDLDGRWWISSQGSTDCKTWCCCLWYKAVEETDVLIWGKRSILKRTTWVSYSDSDSDGNKSCGEAKLATGQAVLGTVINRIVKHWTLPQNRQLLDTNLNYSSLPKLRGRKKEIHNLIQRRKLNCPSRSRPHAGQSYITWNSWMIYCQLKVSIVKI